ncbi:MAG: hypothetical protein IJV38_07990 [Prevotella sp.]|nr:hypothetical protein [Prevotella sp.]
MKQNKLFKTTAIFKCIITLKNGAHKIVRMTIDKVASVICAVRDLKNVGIVSKRHVDLLKQLEIQAYQIAGCRFINERTGQELLSL